MNLANKTTNKLRLEYCLWILALVLMNIFWVSLNAQSQFEQKSFDNAAELQDKFYFIEKERVAIPADFTRPNLVASGDFNRDGLPDVVAYSSTQQKMGWYTQNSSNGGFSTVKNISESLVNVEQIIAHDVDRDGDQDLIVLQQNPGKILFFNNAGIGTFLAPVSLYDSNRLNYVHVEDLDEDGLVDLIIADQTRTQLTYLKQLVDRSFQSAVIDSNVAGISSITVADVNGNGFKDLLITSLSANNIEIYYQNPRNQFLTDAILNGEADLPQYLIAEDLDGDGDVDIAAFGTSNLGQGIYWRQNQGNGTFSAASYFQQDLFNISNLIADDLDGDGDMDLIFGGKDNDTAYWLENLENRDFGLPQVIGSGMNGLAYLITQDINQDGLKDVLAVSEEDDRVVWFSNIGGRSFRAGRTISRRADIYRPDFVSNTDVDRDGLNDLVIASAFDGKFIWYKNLNNGNFDTLTVANSNLFNYHKIVKSDIDADNNEDFLIIPESRNELFLLESDGRTNLIGSELLTVNQSLSNLHLVDLNLDESNDLILSSSLTGLSYRYWNDGAGSFSLDGVIGQFQAGVDGISSGDLDGNGYPDIVTISSQNATVQIMYQSADSSFQSEVISISGFNIISELIVHDFNNDQLPDFLICSSNENQIALVRNAGNRQFLAPVFIDEEASQVSSFRAFDIDSDGDLDIIATLSGIDQVVWYENSVGTFGAPQIITDSYDRPMDFVMSDFDSDQVADLAIASFNDNNLIWFSNRLPQQNGSNTAPSLIANFADLQVTARPSVLKSEPMSTYFSDADGNPLKYTISVSIDTSAVMVYLDANNSLNIEIGEGYLGVFTITVTATDGNLSVSDSFVVESIRVNRSPSVISSFENLQLVAGWEGATQPVSVSSVFTDPDEDELSYSLSYNRNRITAAIVDDQIVLQEIVGISGTIEITVNAFDQAGLGVATIFTVNITQPNRPPQFDGEIPEIIIFADNLSNVSSIITTYFSDPDLDALTYTLSTESDLFEASLNAQNQLVLAVNEENRGGRGVVQITATDGEFSVTGTVSVWVRFNAPTINYPTSEIRVNRQVSLDWEAIAQAATYEVRVIEINGTDTLSVYENLAVASDVTSIQLINLEYGKSYEVSIRAIDDSANEGALTKQTFSVIEAPASEASVSLVTPSIAMTDSAYRLISLPGSYQSFDAAILFDSVGTHDQDWSLYDFTNDSTRAYVGYSSSNPLFFKPGKAFWFLSVDTLLLDYSYNSPILDDNDDFNIPVVQGWNLIGSPFLAENINWSDVQAYNQIDQPIWNFNQEWSQSTQMTPFGGYYYFSNSFGELKIPYGDRPEVENNSVVSKEAVEAISSIRFSMGKENHIVAVDGEQFSTTEKNPMPAPAFSSAALWFPKSEQTPFDYNWKAAISQESLGIYTLDISYKSANKSSILADLAGWLDRYPQVNGCVVQNLKSGDYQRFHFKKTELNIPISAGQQNLKIWFGNQSSLDQLEQEFLPAQSTISKVYPNPFNPTTSIQIQLAEAANVQVVVYNMLGQKVVTLANQYFNQGTHSIQWDASAFATGVYLLQFIDDKGTHSVRKLTLVK